MQDTVIVGEIEAGEAAKVRKSLEKAIQQVNDSTFDIAELLYTVKSKHLYTTPSFQDYVDQLKIKRRRAQYLTRIVEVMTAINCTRAEYEPLGTTKLREIVRLDPAAMYTNPTTQEVHPMADYIWGLIEMAPAASPDDLAKHVRVLLGETGENDMTFLNIRLPRLVLANAVTPAFEKAAILLGTVKKDADGIAEEPKDWRKLEVICVDFKNDTSSDPEVS